MKRNAGIEPGKQRMSVVVAHTLVSQCRLDRLACDRSGMLVDS